MDKGTTKRKAKGTSEIISYQELVLDGNGFDITPGEECVFCGCYHIWLTDGIETDTAPIYENCPNVSGTEAN